ncbi:MAG: MATE family efflux transporter [Candidatus Cloacimonetes bacterium]|nr:MATE family efflux transporter [Candidatus Cloacimonadota bacterium]
MTKEKIDLTVGNIPMQLVKVSLPIMLTMFMQMAYTLTDMFWIGKMGSNAVSAIGSAFFFTWICTSFGLIPKIGLEVNVAQSAGRNDTDAIKNYIINGLWLGISFGLIYAVSVNLSAEKLMLFFRLGHGTGDFDPTAGGTIYLKITSFCYVFSTLNLCFAAIYNGLGKSKIPFFFNSTGLVLNIILDPLLIYGYFGFPQLGIAGAALATTIAQIMVFTINIYYLLKSFSFLHKIRVFLSFQKAYCVQILKIGIPPSMENLVYASLSIVLARMISGFDPIAVGVQRLGTQIESISWMTAMGFGTGVSAFVGQNFGAGNFRRIWEGFRFGIIITSCLGVLYCLVLLIFPRYLYSIFLSDPVAIEMGVTYLRIICIAQPFLCVYFIGLGAFNGLGLSLIPSVIGISLSAIRIPLALLLSRIYGLNGIWFTISGLLILEGGILFVWFVLYFRHKKHR